MKLGIKLMDVKDIDENGVMLTHTHMDRLVYFVDKKDTYIGIYEEAQEKNKTVPVVVVANKPTYSFVVSVKSLVSELYNDIISELHGDDINVDNILKIINKQEGYYSNLKNMLKLYEEDIQKYNVDREATLEFLQSLFENTNNIDRRNADSAYAFVLKAIKLLEILDIEYAAIQRCI